LKSGACCPPAPGARVFLHPVISGSPDWTLMISSDPGFLSAFVDGAVDFLSNGLAGFTWWQVLIVALVFTHITIASVTIYLHRHSAHRSLDLHPIASHFFRFWLWMTTGMVTKEWTAIHRK